MRLFKLARNETLSEVKETRIAKEKTLQTVTENNLGLIFGLELVCSEFTVDNYRLDTLAYDPETNSFVIIEYKRCENRSVIDQGYAYLGKMLDRKAEFVLKFGTIKKKMFVAEDIDWAQSRVYFVSTAFNSHQMGALIFNDLPISLWEVKSYQDGFISYHRIDNTSIGTGSSASIKKLARKDPTIKKVTKQVFVYTEQYHTLKANDEIQDLYETLKDAIQQMWSLNIEPKKLYIAFKKKTNVVDIVIQKAQLKLSLNVPQGKLIDSLNIAQDVSDKGKWGNGDYQVVMRDDSSLSSVLSLIEQSVKMHL